MRYISTACLLSVFVVFFCNSTFGESGRLRFENSTPFVLTLNDVPNAEAYMLYVAPSYPELVLAYEGKKGIRYESSTICFVPNHFESREVSFDNGFFYSAAPIYSDGTQGKMIVHSNSGSVPYVLYGNIVGTYTEGVHWKNAVVDGYDYEIFDVTRSLFRVSRDKYRKLLGVRQTYPKECPEVNSGTFFYSLSTYATQADFNQDGEVDDRDYEYFALHFGNSFIQ